MYSQFFGFDKLPFRLRPDPDFLYSGREYVRARSSLVASLRGVSRVTLFIGAPGVGKTLLLDDVLLELGEQFALCRINQPHISATELVQALMLQLELPSADDDETTRARPGKHHAPALLIIDDAQLLPNGTLLAFPKILTKTRRLKILLVARQAPRQRGDDLLSRLNVADKPQRVGLEALAADGVRAYIEHRLRLAGGGGKDLFTPDAFAVIHQLTAGSPRLINVLCDAALHAACLRASGQVGGSEIVFASQDARWSEALARDQAASVIDEAFDAQSIETVASGELISVASEDEPEEALPLGADLSAEPAPASAPQSAAATSASFLISFRDARLRAWPLQTGRLSIGRAADNALRLEAPDISRHHCEVVVSAEVSVIKDLGSVNGIQVNGKPVKRHVLKNADVVTLGEHVLRYVVN